VFGAFTFYPYYLKSRISTIPQYLETRFNVACRKYFSVITIFLAVIVDTAAGLYGGALIAKTFFPELNITVFIVVLALIGGAYTAAGGLAAVVYTDVLQSFILIIGTSALALITFAQFDFSWAAATAQLPDGQLSIVQPIDNDVLPWPGLVFGVPLLGFYYWITNQYIVQRILGARSITDARQGATLAGLLNMLPLFILMLPGAFAATLLPDLESPDLVFPTLVKEYLPVGLLGLVLAGVLSAILSSVDSALNSASTLLTLDFIEPAKGRKLKPTEARKIGTWATLGFMVLAAVWAPSIQGFPGLFAYIQSMFAYIVTPVVAVFVMGFFVKSTNAAGALTTLIAGHAIAAITFVLTQTGVLEIHFLYVATLLFFVCCIICAISSAQLGSRTSEEVLSNTMFKSEFARPEGDVPLYADFRLHAAVVIALITAMVVTFW